MQGSDVAVVGGTVVTPEGVFTADVLVLEGRITAIGRGLQTGGVRRIDAGGKLVLPGVIDSHVHMRDPGLTSKEDFHTGTSAAAAGGVTTVLEMPNTLPPVDSVKRFHEKREILAPKAVVDFGLFAVLHDDDLEEVGELVKAGAVGFKAFLGPTTGNIPPPSDGTIFETLKLLAPLDVTVAFHAENPKMVDFYTARVKAEGRNDPAAHCAARPPICETEAIARLCFLAEQSCGRVHIVHMSTGEGARIVAAYKAKGAKVTCETNPQYLLMTETDMRRLGGLGKINPPLRSEEDRLALWKGISSGCVDTLGSDHAPHLMEEKAAPMIWDVPAGLIGVETLLPLALDSVNSGSMSIQSVAALLSRNPAKLFHLDHRKGDIKVGLDGDLAVVDMSESFTIRPERLHSKQKVSPFDGRTVRGAVKYTVVRGNVVYDGEVRSAAGTWVAPSHTA